MLETIMQQWGQLPVYIPQLIKNHSILVIIACVIFLFVLLAHGQFAYTVRWLYVIATIGALIYGYFRGNYSLMWLVAFAFVFLMLFRAIAALIKHVAGRSKDSKFERKALERANKRRGNFEAKQAYSGPSREAAKAAVPTDGTGVTGNTGNIELDTTPKDPLAEIEATKAELNEAAHTAKIDVEAVEAALKAADEG